MYYCPNCSAILDDPNTPICKKCGYDRLAAKVEEEREKARKMAEADAVTDSGDITEIRSVDPSLQIPCPICRAPLSRINENSVSFDLLGKDVVIHDIRIMGMNLRKRAITQCLVTFDGYVCENDHKFFTEFTQSYKELCPVCREVMKRFGQQVRTCAHCHINISGEDYLRMGGRELLEDEGWVYKPDLKKQ